MPKYDINCIVKHMGELWKIVDFSEGDNGCLYKIRMVTRYETEYDHKVNAFMPVECIPIEEKRLWEEDIELLPDEELLQILFGS